MDSGLSLRSPRNDEWRHSRDMICPSFPNSLSLCEQTAQGKPGADCARRSRAREHTGIPCTEAHGHGLQVQPRHPGFPHAMVYGLYVLSPGSGLSCPRCLPGLTGKRSARVAAPGPHDFAVRCGRFARRARTHLTPQRPSQPAPRCVTIARTSLMVARAEAMHTANPNYGKAKCFGFW